MNDAQMIKHLWTHKTQSHPLLPDEELMIERGKVCMFGTTRARSF
jgi:hypothetical protein